MTRCDGDGRALRAPSMPGLRATAPDEGDRDRAPRAEGDGRRGARPSGEPDPVDLHVGARLRYRRMLVGMSLETLASRMGLTYQQIQKYERGRNRISAGRLWRIAQALDAPLDYFFEGLDDAPVATAYGDRRPIEFVGSPEGLALNRAFAEVADADMRRRLVDLVRSVAAGCAPRRRRG